MELYTRGIQEMDNAVSIAPENVGVLIPRGASLLTATRSMPPGDPADQIQSFEIQLIDRLWQSATSENAREIADRTWDLVHDRADGDPVKQRVVECHQALARMTRLGD